MLILKPIFKEKIWGGNKLKSQWGYDIPSDHTGECWAISALENGDNLVVNEPYKGRTLSDLFSEKRELFGNIEYDKFPLLVKIIDARDKLSVQVHPDDLYANEVENVPFGKTECWYILDSGKKKELIMGHNARSKVELTNKIKEQQWSDLLRVVDIQTGDFFYIPSGTVHAICEDTMIYEVQQSSDTTYRLYDYDRLENGLPRRLDIQKSLDVISVAHKDSKNEILEYENVRQLINSKYFSVYEVKVNGYKLHNFNKPFLNVSVLTGSGKINGVDVKKGVHLILTSSEQSFEVNGEMKLIISSL